MRDIPGILYMYNILRDIFNAFHAFFMTRIKSFCVLECTSHRQASTMVTFEAKPDMRCQSNDEDAMKS